LLFQFSSVRIPIHPERERKLDGISVYKNSSKIGKTPQSPREGAETCLFVLGNCNTLVCKNPQSPRKGAETPLDQ